MGLCIIASRKVSCCRARCAPVGSLPAVSSWPRTACQQRPASCAHRRGPGACALCSTTRWMSWWPSTPYRWYSTRCTGGGPPSGLCRRTGALLQGRCWDVLRPWGARMAPAQPTRHAAPNWRALSCVLQAAPATGWGGGGGACRGGPGKRGREQGRCAYMLRPVAVLSACWADGSLLCDELRCYHPQPGWAGKSV